MGIPDPQWGPDVIANLRELDDTAIIELVCAADKVWGERYGDDRTRVPRCACCHSNGFQSGEYAWTVCRKCHHAQVVHGPDDRANPPFTVPRGDPRAMGRGGATQWREG